MLEQPGQGLDTDGQTGVSRLHFGAEARHDGHGRVESVLVDGAAAVPDKVEDRGQAARFKDRSRLAGTDQLQHLDTLLS